MKNGTQKKKVLVVDDEKQLVEILCDELTLRGFEPLAAYDGTSALKLIQTKNPDAIISDYTMPGLNGMDLLVFLKDLNIAKPVIWLTATADKKIFREALRVGVYDFFEKPFNADQIIALVHSAVNMTPEELIKHRPKFLNTPYFEQINFDLDKETFEKLKKHCLDNSISMRRFIDKLIRSAIEPS